MKPAIVLAAILLALTACKSEQTAAIPQPVAMTDAALGFYCQMSMSEHDGRKAQIHLADALAPIFFAQVRDSIAFQRMPKQQAQILAIYVSDMSRAKSWQDPGENNWIALDVAVLVVGSDATGGMGAAEMVPFSRREDAASFAVTHGGAIMTAAEIPDDAILTPEKQVSQNNDDSDLLRRLKAVRQTGGN